MEPIILTPDQHTVIKLLSKRPELSKQFYLSGDTALAAFYLRHRMSDDLDFFTDGEVPLATVSQFMQEVKNAVHATKLNYEHLYDRHIFTIHATPTLKVELTKYAFPRLAPLQKKTTFSSIRFWILPSTSSLPCLTETNRKILSTSTSFSKRSRCPHLSGGFTKSLTSPSHR